VSCSKNPRHFDHQRRTEHHWDNPIIKNILKKLLVISIIFYDNYRAIAVHVFLSCIQHAVFDLLAERLASVLVSL
jgi:hypothetical protein